MIPEYDDAEIKELIAELETSMDGFEDDALPETPNFHSHYGIADPFELEEMPC